MLIESGLALLVVRVALGLYWVEHGLKMCLNQSKSNDQLEKMLSSLKPSNTLGSALLGGIKKNYHTFSIVIPLSMFFSGLLLTLGIVPFLAAMATVVIPVSIIIMEPKAPGAVRNLLLLTTLGLILVGSTEIVVFSPFAV